MRLPFRSFPAVFLLFSLLLVLFLLGLPLREACAQAARGAAVPEERLPRELRELSPRDCFIPSTRNKAGVIDRVQGSVVVVHGEGREAYFGMQGDPVYEKDTLVTLAQSKCRIRFMDKDVVTMAAETEFRVEGFEDHREEGRKSSFFRMLKGRAMFYAMRLFRYRDSRFTLATPTTTIGVRGTKFGVDVYFPDERKTTALLVADSRNRIGPYLAQAAAPLSVTDCFCEEGLIEVDGKTVPPGQMYDGRTRHVIPTPPEVIRSFKQATEFDGDGGKDKTQAEEEASSSPAPKGVTGGVAPGLGETQGQVLRPVEPITPPKDLPGGVPNPPSGVYTPP